MNDAAGARPGDRVGAGARRETHHAQGRKPVYNMRGEAMSKFAALGQRRCLVPCEGFYEWLTINGKNQPFEFRRADGKPFEIEGGRNCKIRRVETNCPMWN
jgi:putative SOS response-associated peptidase YedK